MELKEYQSQALDTFTRWLDALRRAEAQANAQTTSALSLPAEALAIVRDFPRTAWNELRDQGALPLGAGEHTARSDGANRPIPHVCFKVPTGGGKTLLGAAALERLNQPSGLVLWIVPTKAIYAQTRAALWNREHPYRQMLERASGGRVKLIEKDDRFSRADVERYLCVMLIMLPAANRRKNKEFLRMFRNSGRYPAFFPEEDDPLREARLLLAHPDLERSSEYGAIVQSLSNIFKMLRPVVVLDEAHKAYGKRRETSEEFVQAINRFNPSLVIELSATPHSGISNLLVDIGGPALKHEEMIKLPIQVKSTINADWQNTLALAAEELDRLESEAAAQLEAGGRYIRPIAVVRAERTGKDQRDGERIHAEDVRELLETLGVPSNQIAVKSAEVDELTGVELLSGYSPVRWIITKSALMEGWDCPFAYVLVMLDNTKAQNAITQLVGRVMRQPYAQRSDRAALNQCYVYCWNTPVGDAMQKVKLGLEREGLGDLGDEVFAEAEGWEPVEFQRRKQFRDREIFLPQVLHRWRDDWKELDHQRDILPNINWSSIRVRHEQSAFPERSQIEGGSVDIDKDSATLRSFDPDDLYVDTSVRLSWYARRLSDLVPNAWQAARIASDMISDLRDADQTDAQIYRQRAVLVEHMRVTVRDQLDQMAEQIFRDKLRAGEIRFSLDASLLRHRLSEQPYTVILRDTASSLERRPGQPLQLSLIEPVIAEQFDSDLEQRFARYLDEQAALEWWHRISVRRQSEYYLRGWKPERIWPDFIAMAGETDGSPHLLVFETKGGHLADSDDTKYKERVLEALQAVFNQAAVDSNGHTPRFAEDPPSYGEMHIRDGPLRGTFQLVFEKSSFNNVEVALAQT